MLIICTLYYMFVCCFFLFRIFCNAASNVGPYGLFWQPALYFIHRYNTLCLLIDQIKMLACFCTLMIGNLVSRKTWAVVLKYSLSEI